MDHQDLALSEEGHRAGSRLHLGVVWLQRAEAAQHDQHQQRHPVRGCFQFREQGGQRAQQRSQKRGGSQEQLPRIGEKQVGGQQLPERRADREGQQQGDQQAAQAEPEQTAQSGGQFFDRQPPPHPQRSQHQNPS